MTSSFGIMALACLYVEFYGSIQDGAQGTSDGDARTDPSTDKL